MRNPFHARSMVLSQVRDGLMAMCLLVTVVRPTKPRHRTFLGVVQSGRMLALGASGRRFKSCRRDHLRVSYSGNTSAFQADAGSSILPRRSLRHWCNGNIAGFQPAAISSILICRT